MPKSPPPLNTISPWRHFEARLMISASRPSYPEPEDAHGQNGLPTMSQISLTMPGGWSVGGACHASDADDVDRPPAPGMVVGRRRRGSSPSTRMPGATADVATRQSNLRSVVQPSLGGDPTIRASTAAIPVREAVPTETKLVADHIVGFPPWPGEHPDGRWRTNPRWNIDPVRR